MGSNDLHFGTGGAPQNMPGFIEASEANAPPSPPVSSSPLNQEGSPTRKTERVASRVWQSVSPSPRASGSYSPLSSSLSSSRPSSIELGGGGAASLQRQLLGAFGKREIHMQDTEGEVIKVEHTYNTTLGNSQPLGEETAKRVHGKKALSNALTASEHSLSVQLNDLNDEREALLKQKNLKKDDPAFSQKLDSINKKSESLTKKMSLTQELLQNLSKDQVVSKRKIFDSNYHRAFAASALQEREATTSAPLDGTAYESIVRKSNPGLIHARQVNLDVYKNASTLIGPQSKPSPLSFVKNLLTPKSAAVESSTKPEVDRSFGLLRVGVMSDLTNGSTNLQELDAIVKGDKNLQDAAIQKLIDRRNQYTVGTPAYASLQMGINQLLNPEQALLERRERMQLLMLQYLDAQAKRDPSALTKNPNDTWNVVDVRLLDPSKNEVDKESGWVHDETNELLDMAKIFEEFNDKTLILDGTGPSVDKDGAVHLPMKPPEGKSNKITLSATILNISIQGQTENTGTQRELNNKAISTLQENVALQSQEDWQEMKALLNPSDGSPGQSNGTVAEKAVTALLRSGVTVSVGCLSAKDRTGWVVGRSMVKLLADKVPDVRKYLTKQLLTGQSMAAKILNDVTGWRFMKLDPKTMGSDVTFSSKAKHTLGLAAEWGIHTFTKAFGITKKPDEEIARRHSFTQLPTQVKS